MAVRVLVLWLVVCAGVAAAAPGRDIRVETANGPFRELLDAAMM